MSETGYKFDIPKHHKSIIKVIGVGGGGSNAVNHMFNQGIKDVEFVVCNTDQQALKSSPVPNRLQIGVNLTEGLGAGANPEVGKNAAIESKEDIREFLGTDTKMVFITAGMGGGTGTGAAPVIAQVAKELDVLTVGIVTAPFAFEGKKKMKQAQEGIDALKASCDTVLVISNDKLRQIYGNLTIGNAFSQADNVLTTGAKGIAEIITVAGYVNVDFQDVRTVMHNAGAAVMGSAEIKGEDRARKAAEEALLSPLLDNKDIKGAQNILLSIISGDKAELQMDELTEITEFIQEKAGKNADVIFGHGVDPSLEDSIRVTVIATGFEERQEQSTLTPQQNQVAQKPERKVYDLEREKQIGMFDAEPASNNLEEIRLKNDPEEQSKGYSFDMGNNMRDDNEIPMPDDDCLFAKTEDDFEVVNDNSADQVVDQETGMMDRLSTRNRLEEQAKERVKKLKGLNNTEMDESEFKSKLDVPAYLRRDVRLQNVPHSSEPHVSKYNLNDDNEILGNNKFLHDNVD